MTATMEALVVVIETQRKGHNEDPLWMIGEQLKEIAREDPEIADILLTDLAVSDMNLAAAEKQLREYADKNHGNAKCFCISPAKAESILREFYHLPKREQATDKPAAAPGVLDLGDFL